MTLCLVSVPNLWKIKATESLDYSCCTTWYSLQVLFELQVCVQFGSCFTHQCGSTLFRVFDTRDTGDFSCLVLVPNLWIIETTESFDYSWCSTWCSLHVSCELRVCVDFGLCFTHQRGSILFHVFDTRDTGDFSYLVSVPKLWEIKETVSFNYSCCALVLWNRIRSLELAPPSIVWQTTSTWTNETAHNVNVNISEKTEEKRRKCHKIGDNNTSFSKLLTSTLGTDDVKYSTLL